MVRQQNTLLRKRTSRSIKPATQTRKPDPSRVAALGIAFLTVVIGIIIYHHTLVIPIFLGLLTAGKALLKALTPKLALFFVKNSIALKLRQLAIRGSTHFLVLTYKPWRLRIRQARLKVIGLIISGFRRYRSSALWIRASIALVLLILTASSSYLFLALLIIPQAILNWLQKQLFNLLNKLGVTHLFKAIWTYLVPLRLRRRWEIYQKWTLGRRQIKAAQQLRYSLLEGSKQLSQAAQPESTGRQTGTSRSDKPSRRLTQN